MGKPRVSLVVGLFVSLGASFLEAQDEIATDRPDLSSTVVPKGSLQVESGLSWTSNDGHTTIDGTETAIRLGVIPSGEVRVVLPDYYGNWKHNTGAGFADIALGWKQEVTNKSGSFHLSVAPGLSVPTGSPRRTSGGLDPQLGVAWSRSLAGLWSTSGVENVYYSTDGSRRFRKAKPS
jgi:hypothetical protein